MRPIKEAKITPNILSSMMKNPQYVSDVRAGFEAELNFESRQIPVDFGGSDDDVTFSDESDVRQYFDNGNNSHRAIRAAIQDARNGYEELMRENAEVSMPDDDYFIEQHMNDWEPDSDRLQELIDEKVEDGMDEDDASEEANEELRQEAIDEYVNDEIGFDRDTWIDDYVDNADFDDYISNSLSNPSDWDLEPPSSSGGIDDDGFNSNAANWLGEQLQHQDFVNTRVEVDDTYDGVSQDDQWVIEPDGSLSPKQGDIAVEIKSPPEPIAEVLEYIPQFFEWARSVGGYANQKTGFHVGVSLGDMSKFDYLKCALFLGDEHILEQFGRRFNTYTTALSNQMKTKKVMTPELFKEHLDAAMDKFKSGFVSEASKLMFSRNTNRTVSINATHMSSDNPYIEFRIMGGIDYLTNPDMVITTIQKYVYAIKLACDPNAELQLYKKKLGALLIDKSANPDIAQLFLERQLGSANIRNKEYYDKIKRVIAAYKAQGPAPLPDRNNIVKTSPGVFKITFKNGKSTTMNSDSEQSVLADLKLQYPDWYLTNVQIEPYATISNHRQRDMFK